MCMPKRVRNYFLGSFDSESFAYVLYPFMCIFKIFGFVPIKLNNGEIFRSGSKPEVSLQAWLLSLLDLVLYFVIYLILGGLCHNEKKLHHLVPLTISLIAVGFICGVHHLSDTHKWLRLQETTIIAFYTSWVQIVAIFVLGTVSVISSWIRLNDMRRLCRAIFKIDQLLNSIEGIKIDYGKLRKRLFIEFIIGFIIPASLSMVNCIIIQPSPEQWVLITSCFWFICFAPIMLVTFKEFQFYNLLYILRLKFKLINKKLREFGGQRRTCKERRLRYSRIGNVTSVSEIPLTMTTAVELTENDHLQGDVPTSEPTPSVETLQKLLRIYAMVADAVELVLRIFSWHLVLLVTMSIGIIIIQCYNVFAHLVNSLEMQSYQFCFVISWILVQMTVIGVNVSICNATYKTMSQTGPLLHRIQPPTTETDSGNTFYHNVQIFSLEVLQRKQVLSAAGFFDMDFKLITSIIASVTTYLVIIIQFHLNNVPYKPQNSV